MRSALRAGEPTPIPALTGIRFFLALFVVVYHSGQSTFAPLGTVARNLVGCGYVSVSLFFLLSGYVLAYNYLGDKSTDPRSFWIARIARIAPAYLTAIAASIPFFLYERLKQTLPPPGENLAVTVATAVTCSNAWFPQSDSLWNFPAWSLSCELFFYLLFPLFGRWLRRLTAARLRSTIVACALLSVLPPVLYYFWLPDGVPFRRLTQASVAAYSADPMAATFRHLLTRQGVYAIFTYNPIMHLPIFLVGAALGRYKLAFTRSERTRSSRIAVHASILAMLALSIGSGSLPHLLLHNSLMALCFAAFVFNVDSLGKPLAKALSWSPILLLGEASYALYILQTPLAKWFDSVTRHLHLPQGAPDTMSPAMLGGLLVFLCGFSVLTFRRIERPGRRWIRKLLTRGPIRVTEAA